MSGRYNGTSTNGRGDHIASRYQPSTTDTSRSRKQAVDSFASQDIWKNIARVKQLYPKSEKVIKSSYFVFFFNGEGENALLKTCVNELHKYIDQRNLELRTTQSKGNESAVLILKDFNIVDGCLLLSVMGNYMVQRYSASPAENIFTTPQNIRLNCKFYMLSKTKFRSQAISKRNLPGFKTDCNPGFSTTLLEVRVSAQPKRNLTTFMQGVAWLLSNAVFEKHAHGIDKYIPVLFSGREKSVNSFISETRFIQGDILDPVEVSKNHTLVSQSKIMMDEYRAKLSKNNNPRSIAVNEKKPVPQATTTGRESTPSSGTSASTRYNPGNSPSGEQTSNSNKSNQVMSDKPGFLTQEQIKEHCVANISAAKDIMQTKSSQDILKMYIRIPKMKYTDIIYERLKTLRSESHCNIIVLNLNNLHESDTWFSTLDVSKYTTVTQVPHPSTVRILCIGGVTEYILIALEKIAAIMAL